VILLRVGDPARVKLEAFSDANVLGMVNVVSPAGQVVGENRSFYARIAVPNHDGNLRPGMQGFSKIRTAFARSAMCCFAILRCGCGQNFGDGLDGEDSHDASDRGYGRCCSSSGLYVLLLRWPQSRNGRRRFAAAGGFNKADSAGTLRPGRHRHDGPIMVEQQIDVVALRAGIVAALNTDVGSASGKGKCWLAWTTARSPPIAARPNSKCTASSRT